jgi:hypothetical protein
MLTIFRNKKLLYLLLLCFCFRTGNAQYKIVKLESENIFIRYFYKTDTSDEIKNDTTYFLCIRKKKILFVSKNL